MRLLSLLIPLIFTFSSFTQAADKPNFILIMCDDLGWGEVGFNGGTHIRTPHLDEMARNGVVLKR
ncbi:MAG: sulfatase-like hydrolase/transferase, partial [Verrucomicrobiota bacterium]